MKKISERCLVLRVLLRLEWSFKESILWFYFRFLGDYNNCYGLEVVIVFFFRVIVFLIWESYKEVLNFLCVFYIFDVVIFFRVWEDIKLWMYLWRDLFIKFSFFSFFSRFFFFLNIRRFFLFCGYILFFFCLMKF